MNMLQTLEQSTYRQRSSISHDDQHHSLSEMLQDMMTHKNSARSPDHQFSTR